MKMKILICLLALLTALSVLAGCSAKSGDHMASTPGDPYGGSNSASGIEGKPTEEIKPDGTLGEFDRKIIRTVSMNCESKAFDDAVTLILDTLAAHDGYVEASSSSGTTNAKSVAAAEPTGQARRIYYTLRVPAEKLDSFLNALRMNGSIHILSQDMSSSEITGNYYDTKTRLETLTAEKNSLTAMLAGFTDYSNISDMLAVQERLYDVIEEMEALQTKLNLYDSQVALSTVTLSLREVLEYTVVEEPTFGERIGEAFTESWTAFGRGCQDFAVWFVSAFPTLLILAVLGGVVIFLLIRARRNKRK